MPNHTRMKKVFLNGLLWLFLFQFGLTALSLEPGYLDFDNLPDTNFTCVGKVIGGYYADLETNCQMFHVCTIGQADEPMDIRFLCLNGTVFDQETRVCERIDEVDCTKSEQFYSLNLELYGNSGPILEETPEVPQETEPPIIKSSTTTTVPPSTTTTAKPHHFPVNGPDIRFNPEEINISLNPDSPPDIHTLNGKFVDNNEEQSVRVQQPSTTTAGYSVESIKHFFEEDFTEAPRQQQFLIQTNSFRHSQSFPHNAQQYHHPQFHSTTIKHDDHTTARAFYLHSFKPQVHEHHHFTQHRTEKTPQRVQIPIPLLPTLPPLQFSSPAPFQLHHHIDAKRYTKQEPPRIIISASASVSDQSGRRLNYSLGTIGAAHILETPPSSYDEYKESDVGLDPFYHDVPKVKHRRKRDVNPFDVIKSEKEALEVLKFLFTWYQKHQATATMPPLTTAVTPDLIKSINEELSTLQTDSSELYFSKEVPATESYRHSDLFKAGGKFSIIGGVKEKMDVDDYVDDNYEATDYKSFLDTSAAEELYKYYNVLQATTDGSASLEVGFDDEDIFTKTVTTTDSSTLPTTEPSQETTETTETTTVEEQTTVVLPSEQSTNATRTEIHVLSEVHEAEAIQRSSEAPVGHSRGRQRHYDISRSGDRKMYRGRGRGKSRFSNTLTSSTTSTTTVATTTLAEDNEIPGPTSTAKPTYLVKLLQYFAEDAFYQPATTQQPTVSYEPITETPYFMTSTLPTLREIYESTTESTGETVDQTTTVDLTTTIATQMDDTTATTPMVSYEETDSYGTTPSSSTVSASQRSFFDDLFIVPELTTQSDVEIQKSISLPITLLEKPVAGNINDLASSTIDGTKMANSSHLLQVVVATTPAPKKKQHGRHRFSTELTRKPDHDNLINGSFNITDSPLPRSVRPTKDLVTLPHTTPLAALVGKNYVFNCFGKEVHKFYADPRDCRLFHYCTNGYSKNQLLDLKYVCDQKTFFDEDRLICTKNRPKRCLS